jgi:hypothetical protein
MTPFETAFADGERAAFFDKKDGKPRRVQPSGELTPYAVAWWLGYTPRSLTWSLNKTPARAFIESSEAA